MLEACELNAVSEEDYNDLGRAGLGSCLLGGLPDWLVAYAARVVCACYSTVVINAFLFLLMIDHFYFSEYWCFGVGEIH